MLLFQPTTQLVICFDESEKQKTCAVYINDIHFYMYENSCMKKQLYWLINWQSDTFKITKDICFASS